MKRKLIEERTATELNRNSSAVLKIVDRDGEAIVTKGKTRYLITLENPKSRSKSIKEKLDWLDKVSNKNLEGSSMTDEETMQMVHDWRMSKYE
jgi:hypothetical protein